MVVSTAVRESIGSARSRLPSGESRNRKESESMVQKSDADKEKPGMNYLDDRQRE